MNDAFAPLYSLLSGHFGWLPTLIAWIGALRIPLKLVNGWLQGVLTQFVVRVQDSPETDDDAQLKKVLGALWYRFLAFTLDAVFSLKLPTTQSLTLHRVSGMDLGALPMTLIVGFALLGVFGFSGCAYLRSETRAAIDPQTNVRVERTVVRAYTLFDSQSQLAKFRNSTGATGSNGFVIPPGTSIGQLDTASSGTNAVNLLEGVVGAAVRAAAGH